MKCPKCDFTTDKSIKFCPNCGSPIQSVKYCSECGSEWPTSAHFCGKCGTRFPETPTETPSSQPPANKTPATSTPIKDSESEGYRKHVTVLVVDMKGSTEMIRSLDPEEAKEILFPAIQKMSSIVYEYGGIVISTAGDGLLAVFGAPKAYEDHALRGCLAAMSMQKQIKTVNAALTVRVGLNSGEVLLAYSGSKFDVVGIVVNLAARMEQTAVPGTVRFTQNTFKLVQESIFYEKVGTEEIKGFKDPIEVYELKGVKVAKSLNELTNQFVDRSEYVDREQEQTKVINLLKEAKGGRGNIIGLVAEAGLGKSRFFFEVVRSEAVRGFNILLSACFIHTKEIPLLPIMNIFRNLLGISYSETDINKIEALIAPFIEKITTPFSLNALLGLLNLSIKDPNWEILEPALRQKYMFEVGWKVICNYSLQAPLFLIIEDLHWADTESELFIDTLLPQIDNQKILIIISHRPEFKNSWIKMSNYSQIVLSPLSPEFSLAMFDNLLGTDSSLKEIKAKLLKTVGGNPFFLEESVLSLIADKVFVGEPKKYRLKDGCDLESIHIPETVINIYQTKIENLPPLQKKILQMASVLGNKFLYSQLIELLVGVDGGELRSALNTLVEKQFIYERQIFPEPGFGFTRALTYETAYNSLLKKTRKELHFKIFEMLQATLQENQIDELQIVAEHAYLSETWDKAYQYCSLAAEKVYEISAFSYCVKNLEKALTAISHLPINDAMKKKIMQLHYESYYAYVPLGRFKEQQEHLIKALEIAIEQKDQFFQVLINAAFAIYSVGIKDSNDALKYGETARKIAIEFGSVDGIVISQFTLSHIYLFRAEFKQLFEANKSLQAAINDNLDFRSVWLKAPMPHIALNYECWGRSFCGDFSSVEQLKEKWFASAKDLNRPSIPNMCRYGSMGLNAFLKGDFEIAMNYIPTALSYSLATEVIIFAPIFFAILAEIYLIGGKKNEGRENLTQAINIVDQIHGTFTAVFAFEPIANVLLMLGEQNKAKEFCDISLQTVKERNILIEYPILLKVSAAIDLNSPAPNFEEIKKKLDEALKLTLEYGMLPHHAHCHFTYADYAAKIGNLEMRKEFLAKALTSYEQLGMKSWAQRVKSLSGT